MLFAIALLTLAGGKQPQMAASANTVALVYGTGHSVMFARSTDGGASFSTPARIAELPALHLGRHRGPRVAFSGKAIVVSAIDTKDLLAWRSTDNGATWTGPVRINDVPDAAREGLHAMTADREGHLAAAWLDLRAKGTRLYASFSDDGGATWSRNQLVYESPSGTICQCCHPSLAALGNGEFAAMFRNAVDGSRDLYLATIKAGHAGAAQKLGQGTWKIEACPMDGGGLTIVDGKPVTAWRRENHIFIDQPGRAEQLVGDGKDIALANAAGQPIAAWTNAGALELWNGGKKSTLSQNGSYPSLLALPSGRVLAAWEEPDGIHLSEVGQAPRPANRAPAGSITLPN